MEPFQVGEIVIGKFKDDKLWPCILLKISRKEGKKWKVERIGDFTKKSIEKENVIKFQSASIPDELFNDLSFAKAYEDALQMYKEFYHNEHLAVDMFESESILLNYKLTDENKNEEQDLIVDILTYLTQISQKLISYHRSKLKKFSKVKFYPWEKEEINGIIIMCKYLKTQTYSIDFVENSHLGSLLSFILNNIDGTKEEYKQCISSIEDLINYIKKCLL